MSKSIGKVAKVASLGVLGSDSVGGKSKAPKAPDYAGLAEQQSADQQKIAEYLTGANRPSQEDAFGNYITWSKDPTTGAWKQSVGWNQGVKDQFQGQIDTANLAGQQYKNQLNKLVGKPDFKAPGMPTQERDIMNVGRDTFNRYADKVNGQKDFRAPAMPKMDENLIAKGATDYNRYLNEVRKQGDFKTAAMPKMDENLIAKGATDYNRYLNEVRKQGDFKTAAMPTYNERNGKAVSDATYNAYRSRAVPEQQRRTSALDAQLRMQGVQPGTEAYDRAMRNQMTSNADADYQAAQQATLTGYDEARQRYMSQLAGQGQRFQQDLTKYQMPWDKLNAMQDSWMQNRESAMQKYAGKLAGQGQGFQQDLTKYQMPWDKLNAMQDSWMQNRESGIQKYLALLQGQGQKFGQKLTEYQMPWEKMTGAHNMWMGSRDSAMQQYAGQLAGQGQQFGQKLTEYNMPWQQAGLLQGMASDRYTPQMPGFSGATGWNAADQVGAANAKFSNNMAGFNAQQQKKGQTLGAGAQLGAAALLSDERLKDDIVELDGRQALEDLLAIGGYSWTWKEDGTPDVGVLAQRVQKVMQDAVDTGGEFLRVNYTTLVGKCIAALGYLATKGGA